MIALPKPHHRTIRQFWLLSLPILASFVRNWRQYWQELLADCTLCCSLGPNRSQPHRPTKVPLATTAITRKPASRQRVVSGRRLACLVVRNAVLRNLVRKKTSYSEQQLTYLSVALQPFSERPGETRALGYCLTRTETLPSILLPTDVKGRPVADSRLEPNHPSRPNPTDSATLRPVALHWQ